MSPDRIAALLGEVAGGRVTPDMALDQLRHLPFEDLGFATIDHHRHLRQGQPEVVFCEGKTYEQVVAIAEVLVQRSGTFFGTRADESHVDALRARFPSLVVNELGRTVRIMPDVAQPPRGTVIIVSAGTSDLPVAEEAASTAEAFGLGVERLVDVGVAGIHRILAKTDRLNAADVVIVAAGMEGALPSVVGGLVTTPVIAVPTSVGYGAAFGGLAALLGMLNSCSSGVLVVNIDNGFGAAVAASRIIHSSVPGA